MAKGLRMTPADLRLYEAKRSGQRAAPPAKPPAESPTVSVLWRSLEPLGGWVREYEFHPIRHWRFDFAQPQLRLAVELEGQVHRIESRFAGDLDKYNSAAMESWLLLRFSPAQVASDQALALILEASRLRQQPQLGALAVSAARNVNAAPDHPRPPTPPGPRTPP